MSAGATQDPFSSTYAHARTRFLEAARAAGLHVESAIHPERGLEGEELAMDVAREGPPDAAALLVLSSACHGAEGFCGSGVQVAALRDAQWRAWARDRGVAVLYVHGLNPFGFSHLQRTTHENIDLNRNFQDFSRPLPANEAYRELHPLLVPGTWPPDDSNRAAIARYLEMRGAAAFQAAITGGQHEFPQGMFFGGTAPSWSNLRLRETLRAHGRRAGRIAWIDFHTGLGPTGVGERIYAGHDHAETVARCKQWWDPSGATPITSIYDGSSTSAPLTGMMWIAAHDECPQAEHTSIALEYGTQDVLLTLDALRASHWLRLHPEAPDALAQEIRQRVKSAFYVETDEWKSQVLRQADEAMRQAVAGLSA